MVMYRPAHHVPSMGISCCPTLDFHTLSLSLSLFLSPSLFFSATTNHKIDVAGIRWCGVCGETSGRMRFLFVNRWKSALKPYVPPGQTRHPYTPLLGTWVAFALSFFCSSSYSPAHHHPKTTTWIVLQELRPYWNIWAVLRIAKS